MPEEQVLNISHTKLDELEHRWGAKIGDYARMHLFTLSYDICQENGGVMSLDKLLEAMDARLAEKYPREDSVIASAE